MPRDASRNIGIVSDQTKNIEKWLQMSKMWAKGNMESSMLFDKKDRHNKYPEPSAWFGFEIVGNHRVKITSSRYEKSCNIEREWQLKSMQIKEICDPGKIFACRKKDECMHKSWFIIDTVMEIKITPTCPNFK